MPKWQTRYEKHNHAGDSFTDINGGHPTRGAQMSDVQTGGVLTAAKRKKIPTSKFGLPGSRKYPMPDRSHAANAKARATQMVKAGKLSSASKAKIDAKANRILGK